MGQPGESNRSIRTQLTRIVLIPSVTFLLLFAVLSAVALGQAVSLKVAAYDGREAVELREATVALQKERRMAAEFLGQPDEESRTTYAEHVEATDDRVARAQEGVETLRSRGNATVENRAEILLSELATRDELRSRVLDRSLDRSTAIDEYTTVIDAGHHLFDSAGRTLDDGPSVAQGTLSSALTSGHEALSRADAVLSGALRAGELTAAERADFAGLMAQLQGDVTTNAAYMGEDIHRSYTGIIDSDAWSQLQELAAEISEHERVVQLDAFGEVDEDSGDQDAAAAPVTAGEWRPAADRVSGGLAGLAEEQWHEVIDAADSAGNQLLTLAVGGGILAFFAGTLAFGIASRSSHRIIRRLLRLRQDSLALAKQDLPRIVDRLERGESVDLSDEMKHLDYGSDEIGQVASAFNIAQRTAVAAAVRQSDIRAGASRVFLGIAHRNQSLVQRQLELLDRIEGQEEDPDLLEELFRLDHLATRGRRHAENLIILGGGQPGRRWRSPVPLVDVLRGAVSETEEYARVRLRPIPDLSLRGAVVADVIHLVAELIENATSFSPPHTHVQVHAESVPKGVAVEIEDRGLGMTEEDLAAVNRTLEEPPEFDVMALTEDSRLGLFVVARLAHRHGVTVQLRPSPYGGTRAIVLIPAGATAPSDHSRQPAEPATPPNPDHRPDGRERAASADPDVLGQPGRHAQSSATTSPDVVGSRATVRSTGRNPAPSGGTAQEATPNGGGREGAPQLPRRRPRQGADDDPRGASNPESVATAAPQQVATEHDPGRPQLPRRTPQANLAPQLRAEHHNDDIGPSRRPPEEVRQSMSALQVGTRRARSADEPLQTRTGGVVGDRGSGPDEESE
ncbi:nitrate- and nitrite sensing domain-containing protein [Lipingzhangella sp. LS1_29]|uniref:histidine kinase n=1 Tax=Lipingzhangella rawalii TaxID=2055835 RepID=A0ABU2H7W3_9ACTN|nr:nitrate- and nitrite sensing domain-containing protein [Lipingzhangella rawalii]MDS1271394.1 nitrate- and nitrite sensing domain-containing protein [Lipingzhangella rawalii]